MTRYTVFSANSNTTHNSASHALAKFQQVIRCGYPCSLYIGGECAAAANGAYDRVDAEGDAAFRRALEQEIEELSPPATLAGFRRCPFRGNPPFSPLVYGWVLRLDRRTTRDERAWLKATGFIFSGGTWQREDRVR